MASMFRRALPRLSRMDEPNPVIDWSKYPPPPRAPGSYQVRNLPPIVGRLRRQILLDISVAFGVGMTMGYIFWYGYHVPAVRRRDMFYEKLEKERVAKYGVPPADDEEE